MCVVCTDWLKGKMTNKEALRALGEFIQITEDAETKEHYYDTAERVLDQDMADEAVKDSGGD